MRHGLVYCEAFGYACPAFARNVGGVSTIIENGKTGLLFQANDSAASCAGKIRQLVSDERAYSAMCRLAREAFDSTFNWNRAGQAVADSLAEALGEGGNYSR